jgi:DNA-binding transcriptional ArsR family regulator
MGGDPEVKKQLRELNDQVEELRSILDRVAAPYTELASYLERFQAIAGNYFRLLDLYQRHGAISPELVVPGLKDPISRDIVRLLFEKGDQNISQIAEALKGLRGSASRRIVREKLADLEARGVVVADKAPRWPTYRITDEVARKWADILGLPKRPTDQ